MQKGSIVKLKENVEYDVAFLLQLAMGYGVKQAPVYGREYVVEDMMTEYCENCKKDHTYLQLDTCPSTEPVWDMDNFVEVMPPQAISVEEITKQPEKIQGEGAESVEELHEERA